MGKKSTDHTVFVRFLPPSPEVTRFHLEDFFSNVGPIKKCSVISSSSNNNTTEQQKHTTALGYGFVKFVAAEDALEAARTHNGSKLKVNGKSFKLKVEVASNENQNQHEKSPASEETSTSAQASSSVQPDSETAETQQQLELLAKRKRTCRVIVRNLSFYAKERDVKQCMESMFGPVVEVNLPRVNERLHRGFAFVTFQTAAAAHKAVQPREEPVLIKKRPVAIDVSVSKNVHEQQRQQQKKREDMNEEEQEDDKEESKEEDEMEESSADDGNDNSTSGSDSSDTTQDDESESESDGSHDGDDEENAVEEEDSTVKPPEQEPPEHEAPEHDQAVDEKRTLFIRNLPFDVTRHDLFELLSPFGYISGIYLVKDKVTGAAKGTAFCSFEKSESASQVLEAAGGGETFVTQREGSVGDGGGLHLRGRRLFVDLAVDKQTASTLTAEKREDGTKIHGKDRRNLYLKMEGRVANQADGGSDNGAWESLPESDQQKRQRAFSDKNTKLRSPLFFINPFRLSLRNLAKHVDEAMFKKLCVLATRRGLDTNLVSQEDQVAHWRATGEMTTRDILQHITEAKETNEDGSVIPPFDEKNIKHFIPSVFIDRDFSTNKKEKAPSRGFGFVDFTHHAHALACLRELNNNPYYSEEYAAGGKRAVEAKRRAKGKKKGEMNKGEFVGEDGRVLIPRLIIDFTVENKAKAKRQAEHRDRQQANAEKQRKERREKILSGEVPPKKKKGRGALQREKKRKEREAAERGETVDETTVEPDPVEQTRRPKQSRTDNKTSTQMKGVKPPMKRKVDKEDQNFESLVQKYRASFGGKLDSEKTVNETKLTKSSPRTKRWFED